MRSQALVALAFAGGVASTTLTEALASQNSSLSKLNDLTKTQPDIVASLNSAKNVTILAPNNEAIDALLTNPIASAILKADPGIIKAILEYHVFGGVYYASNFTSTPIFLPSMLKNATYANVTDGRGAEAVAMDGNVTFYSGLKENAIVVTPNVNFTDGTIHIVDRVLTIPFNSTSTLLAANLTAAFGAVQQAGLATTLDQQRDVTIFAPSNAAFDAIGSLAANLTMEQLKDILQYHVVADTVAYSPSIANSTVDTVGGGKLTLSVLDDGSVFVNSAKILIPDILVGNGVLHVLDNVLNPLNASALPQPASSNPPAFGGASTATSGGVPFTSGVPVPTSTAPAATGAGPGGETSTSSGMGVPVRTGAVAAAVLFGGAAVLVSNWPSEKERGE